MSLSYSTVLISDFRADLAGDGAKDISKILGKKEIDATVKGVLAAVEEVMDRMFAVGHIVSPDELYKRAEHYFTLTPGDAPIPLETAEEILHRQVPEKISAQQLAKVACYVKSRIMALFYDSHINHLRQKLLDHALKNPPPSKPWNARSIKVGKYESLHDFLRTTLAPSETDQWFEANFLKNFPEPWTSTYNAGEATASKPFILYKHNGQAIRKRVLDMLRDDAGRNPIVKDKADQKVIFGKRDERKGQEADWITADLIASNIGLCDTAGRRAEKILKPGKAVEVVDLVAEGTLGLAKSLEKFDKERGFALSTYAVPWIRQAAERHAMDMGSIVRKPIFYQELIRQMKKSKAELINKLKRLPTQTEIAEYMGVTLSRVRELIRRAQQDVSFDNPDDKERPEQSFANLIPSDSNQEEELEGLDLTENVVDLLATHLSTKEAQILRMRNGMGGEVSINQISKIDGNKIKAHLRSLQNQEKIGSFKLRKNQSNIEVETNEELLEVERLRLALDDIAKVLETNVIFKLESGSTKETAKLSDKARSVLKLIDAIKVRREGNTVFIECDSRDVSSLHFIRGNLPQLIAAGATLKMCGRLSVTAKQGVKVADIEKIIQSFESGINSTDIVYKQIIDIDLTAGESFTLEEIAGISGVSREHIRQIESKATRKLRREIKASLAAQ